MPMFKNFPEPEQMIARRRVLVFLLLLNVFAAVLVVSYGLGAWRDLKAVIRGEERLSVSVSGEGTVTARPDVARITATILTQNEFLKPAQEENSRKSNVLVGYLKSVGVEEKDIKTVGYNIYPQYRYPQPCPFGVYPCPPEEPKITGYQVRNSYEITVRDLGKASDILAGVVGAGANEVSGIAFTIDKPEELQAQARKLAIDDASAKAKKLAHDLGRRLGKIINFSEGGYFPPPVFFERGGAFGKGGDVAPAPSVQPGENEIVVTVSITYEFK